MQTYRAVLALFTIVMCLPAGTAVDDQQAPPRDARPAPIRDPAPRGKSPQPPTGSASISGTVVALSSDEPLADATVAIYAPVFPDGRTSTATDQRGRFQFTNLPAGRYTVGASKTGFVNFTHGQRQHGHGGRAIPLRDGEHRDIRLPLPRPSVITGMVVDARGGPAANASVRAFRFYMGNGYRRGMSVGSATTDNRGIYRILPVEPGDYAVCVSTRETGPLNESQRLQQEIDRLRRSVEYVLGPAGIAAQQQLAPRLASLEARLPPQVDPVFGYAPVCHPGTPSLPSMIRVAPNEDRTGVDFQLALTRLARIEGVAVGMPALNTSVDPILLVSADEMEAGTIEGARPNIEGRFRFTNVSPGRYRLILRGTAEGPSPVFASPPPRTSSLRTRTSAMSCSNCNRARPSRERWCSAGPPAPPQRSPLVCRSGWIRTRPGPSPLRGDPRSGLLTQAADSSCRMSSQVNTGSRRASGKLRRDGSWTRRRSPAGMFWTSRWR